MNFADAAARSSRRKGCLDSRGPRAPNQQKKVSRGLSFQNARRIVTRMGRDAAIHSRDLRRFGERSE